MSTEYQLKARVLARSGEIGSASFRVIQWSKKERTARALKIAGIGCALAFVFIFLPIVHFVLVPLALILTPIVSWLIYQQAEEIPTQVLDCPRCKSSVQLPSLGKFQKQELLCEKCRTVLEITPHG